jgi:acetyl-CoA acetyltransferase
MSQAYIVDAVRTATGRRKGALAAWHPVDLGAASIDALLDRTGIDPAASRALPPRAIACSPRACPKPCRP